MKHLPCGSCIAPGNSWAHRLTVRVHAVLARNRRQSGTSAANQPSLLRDGEASVERPVGKLFRRCSPTTQAIRAQVFECIGHDCFKNSASSHQRNLIVAFRQGAPAVGIGLFEYGTKFGIVNEFEPARGGRVGRSGRNRLIVRFGERSDGLSQNNKQLLSELGRRGTFHSTPIRGAHQKSLAERTRQPMRLAAPRQLIDGYATVLLPASHCRHSRRVRGIARQLVAKLLPTANQALKMGQVSLDLRLKALIHGYNVQPFYRLCKYASVRRYEVLTLLYNGGKVRPASGSVIGPVYNTMRHSRGWRGVLVNPK